MCNFFETCYSVCTLLILFLCPLFLPPGSTVEQFPWYLWWAAADVHCSGGSRICQGHPREHAQHSGHWPVYGCSQTAVHRSYSWEPPLLLPRWDKCEDLCKLFSLPEDTKNNHTCKSDVQILIFSFILTPFFFSVSLPSESRSNLLPVVLHHIHLHLRQQRELLICSGILSSIFSIIKTSSMVQYIHTRHIWLKIPCDSNWIRKYNIEFPFPLEIYWIMVMQL